MDVAAAAAPKSDDDLGTEYRGTSSDWIDLLRLPVARVLMANAVGDVVVLGAREIEVLASAE